MVAQALAAGALPRRPPALQLARALAVHRRSGSQACRSQIGWLCSAQCCDHALVVLARRENERGEAGVRVFSLSVRPSLQQRLPPPRQLPLQKRQPRSKIPPPIQAR